MLCCLQINFVLQATGHSAQENMCSRSSGLIIMHSSGYIHSKQRCPKGFWYVTALFPNWMQTMVHALLSAEKYSGGHVCLGTNGGLFSGILKTTLCELQHGIKPDISPSRVCPEH